VLVNLAAPAQLHHPEEFVNLRLAAAVLGDLPDEAALLPEFPASPPGGEPGSSSFFDYQYQSWDGGTLVVALLLVPLSLLFGLSTTSLKAGALLWCVAGLSCWVLLLRRVYGNRGLWAGAFCFAAMPVPYLLQSCIHWGNHVESALFVPLGLLTLLWASEAEDPRCLACRTGIAGMVFGFGAWFSLLNLAPMALAFLALPLLFGPRLRLVVPIFVLGCAVGLLPWLGRNDLSDLGGGLAHGQSFSQVLGSALSYGWNPASLWELLSSYPKFAHWQIYHLWTIPETLATLLDGLTRLAIVLGALAALSGAALAARDRRDMGARSQWLLLIVLLGSALLIPILLASQGEHSDRRLGPVYPLLWAVLASGLASLTGARKVSSLFAILVGLVLAGNLFASVAVISSWDRPDDSFSPWQHFALPAAEPRDRTDACVPHVASDQVGALNGGLRKLFLSSVSGGYAELRGICRAFAARGTFLERSYPGCPDRWEVDIMELWLVDSVEEAVALGVGLKIRCPDARVQAKAICEQLHGDKKRSACLSAL
jgi:hypothetical protein